MAKKKTLKKYTEAKKNKLLAEYRAGTPIASLSETHSIHPSTIYGWLKQKPAKVAVSSKETASSVTKSETKTKTVAVSEEEVRYILKWYKKDALSLDSAVKALLG